MLTPLVADCQKHDTIQAARNQLVANRDALETYFIFKKVELLDKRIKSLGEEHTAISARIERNQEKVNKQKLKRDDLKQTISENGGNRLSKLATEIDTKEREPTDIANWPAPSA
jgi:uncharacterized protein YPO0396